MMCCLFIFCIVLWRRVCDLGLAREVNDKSNRSMTLCGTDEWMAPEVIMGGKFPINGATFGPLILFLETVVMIDNAVLSL